MESDYSLIRIELNYGHTINKVLARSYFEPFQYYCFTTLLFYQLSSIRYQYDF